MYFSFQNYMRAEVFAHYFDLVTTYIRKVPILVKEAP